MRRRERELSWRVARRTTRKYVDPVQRSATIHGQHSPFGTMRPIVQIAKKARLLFAVAIVVLPVGRAAAATPTDPGTTSPESRQAIGAAIGQILHADGPRAKAYFAQVSARSLSAKDAELLTCMTRRLDEPAEAARIVSPITEKSDEFVDRVLLLYREYWRQSVSDPAKRPQADSQLVNGLTALLGKPAATDVPALELALKDALERRGFYSLQGRTGLLHELMIWTKESTKVEAVKLPESTNSTTVHYLDNFVSTGWSSYFTCDRTGTGGWTTDAGLFVVVPGYKSLTDEHFRVNFLDHESQHYADYKRFPNLKPWELEYRAKLVELAYAVTTSAKVIGAFQANQGDNPGDQHSYANRRVIDAVRTRLRISASVDLTTVPVPRIQRAALSELYADSARRRQSEKARAGHARH